MSTGAQPPAPAGWYPDGSGQSRYWDGERWTDQTQLPASAAPPVPMSPITPVATQPMPAVYYGYGPPMPQPQPASGLYTAAAVINWVVLGLLILGTFGLAIIAAAWFVPMTIYIHKGARDGYKHTGLAVCTLLFCNLVSGILMLVDEGKRVDRPFR